MRRTQQITPEATRLLAVQDGVITREQALGCGLGRRAIERFLRDERWSRAAPGGVYLKGCAGPTFVQRLWVGHLLAGEGSAIGGWAALHRRGVGLEPETVTVVVPLAARRRLPLEYELVRDGQDRLGHVRGGPPLIRSEDALLDATARLPLERFVGACTDLIRLRRTTAREVETVLRQRRRHPGKKELLEVLADLQGIESNLEWVFRRDVLRAHGLPEGRWQVRTGRRRRLDVHYDEFAIIIELDGRRGHVEQRFRDFARDNEHAAMLLTTFRFGSFDVRGDPCAIARQLGQAFLLRGWGGGFAPCESCPQ